MRGWRRVGVVVVAALVAGMLPLEAVADDPAPVTLAAFEGGEPFAAPPNAGIFTWGSDADDPPTLELQARADAPAGEKVLHGTYDISGWGGFSHDVTYDVNPGDWSPYKGIRFWWYVTAPEAWAHSSMSVAIAETGCVVQTMATQQASSAPIMAGRSPMTGG